MDLRAKTDDCLILRGRDYNETDRLLTVFGRDMGKLSCIARGVRRPNSRLKAGTQLFSYATLTFAPTRGTLNLITQSEAKNVHAEIRADLTKIAVASYISEMLDAVLPEAKPQPQVFILAEAMFTLLAADAEPFLVLSCFRVRLLNLLGFRLQFEQCAACGAAAATFAVSPARGGLLCPVCAAGAKLPAKSVKISAGAARLLSGLAAWDLRRVFNLRVSPQMQVEVDAALSASLEFFIGSAAKAAAANLAVYYSV